MRVEDLSLFVKVAEFENFSQAAKALDLPRANVSRRISELEKSLGIRLFTRDTRHIALTQLGSLYYNDLQKALDSLSLANQRIKNVSQHALGKVKLGLLPASEEKVSDILADFQRDNPKVELELMFTHNCYRDFRALQLDLGIYAGALHDSSFIGRPLFEVEKWIVASPEYVETYGRPSQISDMAELPSICFRDPDGQLENFWQTELGNVWVNQTMVSNHYGFICAQLRRGRVAGLVPSFLAKPAIDRGELVRLLPTVNTERQSAYLIYPNRQGMSMATQVLLEYLLERVNPPSLELAG